MATSPASGNVQPSTAGKRSDSGKFVEYDRFIDSTLRKTRQQVRNVDIAGGVMLLGAGTLVFFLLVALVDHWVVPGGLGVAMRWTALGVYLAGAAVYCWRSLVPLLVRRINPVYAAHSIECSKPSLKNSLVNFLLLRANPAGLTQNVYEAIEEQAATNLAKVPVEGTVDRTKLIRIGYVFLAVLLISAIYKVVSPKDPLRTDRPRGAALGRHRSADPGADPGDCARRCDRVSRPARGGQGRGARPARRRSGDAVLHHGRRAVGGPGDSHADSGGRLSVRMSVAGRQRRHPARRHVSGRGR